MSKPTLGLCMIAKNEEENIARCLESVVKYVDHIYLTDTGSTDKTVEIAKRIAKWYSVPLDVSYILPKDNPDYFVTTEEKDERGKKITYTDIKFAMTRNFNFNQAKTDYIIWLDADDTVEGAMGLSQALEQIELRKFTILGLDYRYEVDDQNRDIIVHTKERILKTGIYQWEYEPEVWLVHENLYIKDEFKDQDNSTFSPDIKIRHWADSSEANKSGKRNVRLLKYMLSQMGDAPDPRALFLMGRELYNLRATFLAKGYLDKYIRTVENLGDRMLACSFLNDIALGQGEYKEALVYGLEGVKSRPDLPTGYLGVARAYLLLGQYDDAIRFVEDAAQRMPSMGDNTIHTPYQVKKLSTFVLAHAYSNKGNNGDAVALYEAFLPEAYGDDVKLIEGEIEEMKRKANVDKISKSFSILANTILDRQTLDEDGEPKKNVVFDKKPVDDLIALLPEAVNQHPRITRLKRKMGWGKILKKPHITIYCALNFEKWDPDTIINNGGGGSETAVIEMASRFARVGYGVDVYANPTKHGTVYEGVNYYDHRMMDLSDTFDIFISWRSPWIFKDAEIIANKKFIWLQDIMNPFDYPIEVTNQLDKIIVLSQYHRSYLPAVDESKFFYTTNGINLDLIEEVEQSTKDVSRDTSYCIYASSADRGLLPLTQMWGEVKRKVKNAHLTWFYGWNSFDKMATDESKGLKKTIIKFMQKNKVTEGGRIGKRELYENYFKARFLTYPLTGPAETSCITVMEAQACGCFPITTGITALEETQQFGVKVDLDQYADTLVEKLNSSEDTEEMRQKMMGWAREQFSWDRVAKQWVDEIFYGDLSK